MMKLRLSPFFAKLILHLNLFGFALVMCKGYGEDYDNFTELVLPDDHDLDFFDRDSYPEYELWFL